MTAVRARIEATPEFVAMYRPAFQARMEQSDLAATEVYVPFAVDLPIRSFSRA